MAEQRADAVIPRVRPAMKRRGILAVAGVAVAGAIARQAAQPVLAATAVTLANDVGSIVNNETISTYVHNTGNNTFKHTDAAVLGESDNGPGLYGTVNFANTPQVPFSVGVYGDHGSSGGIGVHGVCAAPNGIGVIGQADAKTGIGVKGTSAVGVGVFGVSNGNAGILGVTTAPGNAGLGGITNVAGTTAFAGTSTNPNAFAGFFTGDVFVNGNFTVQDPTRKHGAIAHPDGSYRILYSMESPESWLEDFGKGTLANGAADVKLDPDFAAVTHTEDYHVFLTPRDPACKGLAVATQRPDGFVVQEMNGGSSNGAFSYRVVAKPKTTNKATRLAKFSVPEITLPQLPTSTNVPPPKPQNAPSQTVPQSRPSSPGGATQGGTPQGTVQNPILPAPSPRTG